MKVSNTGIGTPLTSLDSTKTNKPESNDGSPSSKLSRADLASSSKVQLSERAQNLQKAREIATKDDIDEAKVARLQKLIDEGKYKVDAGAVADRLVNEHLMLPE